MDSFLNKPFAKSFTMIPGRLWGGAYPGDRDPYEMQRKIEGLLKCKVKAIINLMEADEVDHEGLPFVPYEPLLKGKGVTVLHLPIPDVSVRDADGMDEIMYHLHDCVRRVPTFVHCWGGRGRTGTVVGSFFIDAGILTGEQALHAVHIARSLSEEPFLHKPAPETMRQRKTVLEWTTWESRHGTHPYPSSDDGAYDIRPATEMWRRLVREHGEV
ncbi:MAG: hypothetical protein V1792_16845 [Pseudomonadota bacterium]